ncbi:MAG TPA: hypothetical protein VK993_10040 [Chthoniobacterales bacterium]|nr:hypothetical protein [Chthoniobacterales bacterium]
MSDGGQTNPTADQAASQQSATEQQSTADARAEEVVDRLGERLGYFFSQLSRRAEWAIARAREEAEDIWAEAQEIRRKKRP